MFYRENYYFILCSYRMIEIIVFRMSLDRLSRKKSCSLDSNGESLSPSDNSISSNVCNKKK